jgi:uncharacterized damage-inducible protein DinB
VDIQVAKRLREEVSRVIDGDADGVAFHGPSTKSNLTGVTAELAATRPVAGGHSIWELVTHIRVGREWSVERLKGRKPEVEWWPAVYSQEAKSWETLLRSLNEVRSRFLAGLAEPASEEDARAAVRFLVHHELYHSGQIAIVRKALGMEGRPG